MTTQLACQPIPNGSDPLGESVRALARDSECVIKPGANARGVFGAGTIPYHRNKTTLLLVHKRASFPIYGQNTHPLGENANPCASGPFTLITFKLKYHYT